MKAEREERIAAGEQINEADFEVEESEEEINYEVEMAEEELVPEGQDANFEEV